MAGPSSKARDDARWMRKKKDGKEGVSRLAVTPYKEEALLKAKKGRRTKGRIWILNWPKRSVFP